MIGTGNTTSAYVHSMNTQRKSLKIIGAWRQALIALGIVLSLLWAGLLFLLLLRLFHLV
jgi:hypothetical protein